jgi:uncharacterized protein
MVASQQKDPLIAPGWLRVLLFFVLYAIVTSLVTKVVVNIALPILTKDSTKDATLLMSEPPLIYLITTTVAVVSFLLVLAFRIFLDRRSLNSLGFATNNNGANAATGMCTGIVILCAGTLFLNYNRNLEWTGITMNPVHLFTGAVGMMIVALSEELVFRGYILSNLLENSNKWVALVATSLLFAIMHGSNPNVNAISLVNIFMAGLLLGVNYIYTKNLWYAVFLHFTWNFLQGPVLGYEVSGFHLESLLHQQSVGHKLITGGIFGFEGSIVATILTVGFFLLYLLVYRKKYALISSTG